MQIQSFLGATLVATVLAIPSQAQDITYARRLPDGNLRELAKLELPERPRKVRTHRFLPPVSARPFATGIHSVPRTVSTALNIPAPPVTLGFTSGTSRQISPADASGAVGPGHVVGVYNNGIVIHDRSGNVVAFASLRQFWALSSLIGDQYDPRIAYDASRDRWVMVAIDREESLLFAVSDSGDPAGTWHRYDANLSDATVDFTRIAVTRDSILLMTVTGYEAANSVVLSIRKDDLYSGMEPMKMKTYREGDPGVVPVDGDTANEYIVSLMSFAGIRVERLGTSKTDFVPAPAWVRYPAFLLPQLNSPSELLTGYNQVENAVYRNGSIYAVFTADGDKGQSSGVVWCRFDPVTLESEWGLVSDPEGEAFYAYPSIAVNERGEMLIGVGTFSARQYPTAAYIFRDMFGRTSLPGLIRTGDSPFTENERWGDYTGTVADPVEPGVFWTVQITTNKGAWGTVWARVEQPPSNRRRSTRH